ncbi:MAG: cupin domain-containing protein [Acidobacteria bacterium]|nr:cupin domain-containing protein [Acidobacteriota bacterium]
MKRVHLLFALVLAVGVVLGVVGSRMLSAQNPLTSGTVLNRTELKGCKGMEAILVSREVPPGKESGKHTQAGNEIVYILEGSVTLEVKGKPPVTLKAGQAFHTVAGDVHNVKNASATAPAKAIAFYVAKTGTALEGLSVPAK